MHLSKTPTLYTVHHPNPFKHKDLLHWTPRKVIGVNLPVFFVCVCTFGVNYAETIDLQRH